MAKVFAEHINRTFVRAYQVEFNDDVREYKITPGFLPLNRDYNANIPRKTDFDFLTYSKEIPNQCETN